MLSLSDTAQARNCDGWTRREWLRVGAFSFGGLSLSQWCAFRAAEAALGTRLTTGKSVIFLFLQGGPSQIETFDPKMTAPAEVRSVTGETPTRHAGISFGGTFPQLAKLADRFSIVRSYASNNSGHSYQEVASGRNPLKATMGAIYAHIAGTNDPQSGMPTNVLLLPEAVCPDLKPGRNFETNALPTLTAPGDLGPNCAAFNPVGGSEVQQNMELRIPEQRFADRRFLLDQLDQARRRSNALSGIDNVDKYRQQAFDIISRGVAQAFDLQREETATLARYDTSGLFTNAQVQRWGDMRRSSNQLGRQLLLARRLCEAGCGFVTVSDCGWDMHSNNNSPKNLGGMYWLGPQVDHAVAALIEDIEERGLRDEILLVVTGEMGRTPRVNRNGGRDHWGNLTPLLVYGGGLKMGQVVGQSDRQAGRPATTPYGPENLLATVMQVLLDIGQLRITPGVPRALLQSITEAAPISPLHA